MGGRLLMVVKKSLAAAESVYRFRILRAQVS